MGDIKLKPCPKCGSTSVKHFVYDDGYSVFCRRCQFELYPHKLEKVAAEEWNAMPRPLQWTSEPPTEPGWYWYKTEGVVSILSANQIFLEMLKNSASSCEWAGPIPEPQEPQ